MLSIAHIRLLPLLLYLGLAFSAEAADYLGKPEQMYDNSGQLIWDAEYDIYGNVRKLKGSSLNECPFRWPGQYADEDTGLYYNRFRYYSPELGTYVSQDPIRLAGNNPNIYAFVPDINGWSDPLGLSCLSTNKRSIQDQLSRGKNASVKVDNKYEAEALLRDLTSGPGHKGSYMNTTGKVFDPQKNSSDWLPRPSSSKRGTYHWDKANPNAKMGDHALQGDHLQIHTFEGKIIRIFY